jgi:hypothetical protein
VQQVWVGVCLNLNNQEEPTVLNSKFAMRALLVAGLGVVVTCAYAADESATPTAMDHAAASTATSRHHARPAATPRGRLRRAIPDVRSHAAAPSVSRESHSGGSQTRYPGDLQNHGGAVVEWAQSHAIYLRPNGVCPIATCWGNPEKFLRDLSRSDLIHTVDEYIGQSANQRYTVGQHAYIKFKPTTTPLTDDDVLSYVHAVASKTGQTGYGHIYHVFLPPGTDECFDSTFSDCYSPDNFDTFSFCAYHGYVDFTDIGHVLYSVEPYQNTPGCADIQTQDGSPLPNGTLIDTTDDTLSHELIETITDPDLDAWWNELGLGMYGEEIADECIFLDGPATFRVEGHKYAAQLEYSNSEHACVVAP